MLIIGFNGIYCFSFHLNFIKGVGSKMTDIWVGMMSLGFTKSFYFARLWIFLVRVFGMSGTTILAC